jgi:AmmeMemoRadiSam system protein B
VQSTQLFGYPYIVISGYRAAAEQPVPTAKQGASVRPAAVAGRFYPGNPQRLRAEVAGLLAGAPAYTGSRVEALIAPHAGYVYSGKVAAAAFAAVRAIAETVRRVVVIGPAHYVALRGIAVATVDAFETPLGQVALDRDAIAAIADLPALVQADAPHAPEHALEVELPFLQMLLGRFELVPLLVGDAAPQEVADVLARLWDGPRTLPVISSDLSHYHDYETARLLDLATATLIARGDWSQLGARNACGFLPVAGLLVEAARRGLKAQCLSLFNSGDTAGDRASVVGYGAWAFAASA